MSKFHIPAKVSRNICKLGMKLKKVAPEILVVTGVVGTVTSTVMACKATTKVNDILEESREMIDNIHKVAEKHADDGKYTEKECNKALSVQYMQTAGKLLKLYGPSIVLGTVSITCIVSSHHILRKRNVVLAAAYKTLEKGFDEYRERLVDRFGSELDKELRYNIKAQTIEETTADEDGKETTVEKTTNVIDPNTIGDFARIYDDGCVGWSKDPEQNMIFLKSQQAYATEKLRRKGHLFLNEVYKMLGFSETPYGQVVGWIYDEKNPVGDNFVDFGIFNMDNERARAFVNGLERNILLDFNHDGNILEMM